jgi:hypothetical protein
MYVSVRRYQVDPSNVEEIVRRVEEGFVPIVSQAPGFIAYYAIDQGGGTIASINVFEDEAGAQESDRRAADWVKTVASLIPNPPEVTAGTVRVAKRA